MLPTQIHQLTQQSPALQEALKQDREKVWQFLRQDVEMSQFQGVSSCERCQREVAPSIQWRWGLAFTGMTQFVPLMRLHYSRWWCIECLLDDFLTGAPITNEYGDPRSRFYDPKHVGASSGIISIAPLTTTTDPLL